MRRQAQSTTKRAMAKSAKSPRKAPPKGVGITSMPEMAEGTMPLSVMMTPTTRTMSYLAFTYSQEGYAQMSDAISVCVLLFILFCYIFANKVAGADIGKSW